MSPIHHLYTIDGNECHERSDTCTWEDRLWYHSDNSGFQCQSVKQKSFKSVDVKKNLPFVTSCRQERWWRKCQRSNTWPHTSLTVFSCRRTETRGELRHRASLPKPPTTQCSANDSSSERNRQKIKQSRAGSSQGNSSACRQSSVLFSWGLRRHKSNDGCHFWHVRIQNKATLWKVCPCWAKQLFRPNTSQFVKQEKHNNSWNCPLKYLLKDFSSHTLIQLLTAAPCPATWLRACFSAGQRT